MSVPSPTPRTNSAVSSTTGVPHLAVAEAAHHLPRLPLQEVPDLHVPPAEAGSDVRHPLHAASFWLTSPLRVRAAQCAAPPPAGASRPSALPRPEEQDDGGPHLEHPQLVALLQGMGVG